MMMTFPPTRVHMLVHMGATEDADRRRFAAAGAVPYSPDSALNGP